MTDPYLIRGPAVSRPPHPSPRPIVLALSGTLTALLMTILTLVHLPYIVEKPGPTFDMFDGDGRDTLLSIEGSETYPPSGELRLTTVAVQGGPDSDLAIGAIIRAWLSPTATVFPYIPYTGGGSIQQEWITSQEMATVAALSHLEIDVPAIVTIVEIDSSSNAVGMLAEWDVVVAVDGETVLTYEDLDAAFEPLIPGDSVTVTVDRFGEEVTVSFPTIDNGEGRAIMGVWVDPEFQFPFTVTIGIDGVGGPSGGVMFALGIVDLLTAEDELRGESVAGTGTIDLRGNVGPIGGIRLKMAGARASGAEWFLAPDYNCGEVLGNIPDGLTVVPVSTLEEAYEAVVAIGQGRTGALPSCG